MISKNKGWAELLSLKIAKCLLSSRVCSTDIQYLATDDNNDDAGDGDDDGDDAGDGDDDDDDDVNSLARVHEEHRVVSSVKKGARGPVS